MQFKIPNEEHLNSYDTSTEVLQAIAKIAKIDIDNIILAHQISDLSEHPELKEQLEIFDSIWADGGDKVEEVIKLAWTYAEDIEIELYWGDTHSRPKVKETKEIEKIIENICQMENKLSI